MVKNHFKKAVKGKLKGQTPVFKYQKSPQTAFLWAFPNGGEGTQPNQGVKFNPTIHYVPYEIVMERTKRYLEEF